LRHRPAIGCFNHNPRQPGLESLLNALGIIRGQSVFDGKDPVPVRRKRRQRVAVIDKSALLLPASRRIRDRDQVRLVAKQPCLVCGRRPADAHHLRFAQSKALGRKVSDEFTVPLCRGHHREVYRCGDEAAWWEKAGIDPTLSARALWLESHPLPTASGDDQSRAEPDRRIKRGPTDKTKPIFEVGPL
jgi:hypothetical protein